MRELAIHIPELTMPWPGAWMVSKSIARSPDEAGKYIPTPPRLRRQWQLSQLPAFREALSFRVWPAYPYLPQVTLPEEDLARQNLRKFEAIAPV
jgi:hypothetical protein